MVVEDVTDIFCFYTLLGFGEMDKPQIRCKTETRLKIGNLTVELLRNSGSAVNNNGLSFTSSSITLQAGLRFTCPIGSLTVEERSCVETKDIFRMCSSFDLLCSPCRSRYYTTKKGHYYLQKIPSSKGRAEQPGSLATQKCLKCEGGGICEDGVRAKDNYWGYVDGDKVYFLVCPRGYCCSSDTRPCVSYNTCAPGRKGVLCGTCDTGYKQNFVSDGCVEADDVQCDSGIFLAYILVYTTVHTVVFVFITNVKDIIPAIKAAIISKRNEKKKVNNDQPDDDEALNQEEQDDKVDDGFSMAAYVQITVLHLQVASSLKVKFQDRQNKSTKDDGISDSISKLLDFRFVIYQKVCPWDTLNLPEKEMILFGMKMTTFLHLFFFAIIFLILRMLYYKICRYQIDEVKEDAPSASMEIELVDLSGYCNTGNSSEAHLTFIHRLEITAIKFLKMYYTPGMGSYHSPLSF